MTMNDPRLNSVHLELPRRQEFRAARDVLLHGCGDHTLCADGRMGFGDATSGIAACQRPNAAASQAAKFVLMDREFVYPLKVGLNTIGRMPDNDVVIDDGYISRRHCAILVHTNDHCELQDVASKNGTFVNNQKINGPTRLNAGDEIRLCTCNLMFVSRLDDVSGGSASFQTQVE